MKIIRIIILLLIVAVSFGSCKAQSSQELIEIEESIITGAERMDVLIPLLKGKTISCVVNHTSVIGQSHLVDSLISLGINVKSVFAPEHGYKGNIPDGEKISDERDDNTGLTIISLYGSKRKPSVEDLSGVEVMIFDIQDVGARFYTYLSTLHNIMESCAENNIPLIILDRPNPNAHFVDGPVMKTEFTSFVGLHPVPVVYGLTIGEYALMINGERWLRDGIQCDIEVIKLLNYDHNKPYHLPIPPSPNLPNMRAIYLYPSLCFFEGTTVSVGRGTSKQFQQIGHPNISSKNHSFMPLPNDGSKYPPQEGKICYGDDFSNMPLESLKDIAKLDLSFLLEYYELVNNEGGNFFLETNHFNRLVGNDNLKSMIQEKISISDIRKTWQKDLNHFKVIRKKYLLYP